MKKRVSQKQYCYVHTKWGKYKGILLMNTIYKNKTYSIIEMCDKQFKGEEKTQYFLESKIELIKNGESN